jgi:hypothetical protein
MTLIVSYDGEPVPDFGKPVGTVGADLVRTVLPPPPGTTIPYPTGTPLGIGLVSDGTPYYADIDTRAMAGDVGPGENLGAVRRVCFVAGALPPPETMGGGLNFPGGIGILEK